MLRPGTVSEAAAALRQLAAEGRPVRPVGSGSRLAWAAADSANDGRPVLDLHTTGLHRVLEHNAGDATAVLEAGLTLADAQARFATAGQWLAIDPPEPGGTIGGLVATADSGPARHRFGSMRDLVIGVTVVLSDGTIASAGGKVIKNVAGYDLGKLFAGSFGTLGLIVSVAVRLHPLPARTASLVGTTGDPGRLGEVALALARAPLEATSLDAWWRGDSGAVLVRFTGAAAVERAEQARPLLARLADVSTVGGDAAGGDAELWARQRAGQRSTDGLVLKVSGRPTDLARVVIAARANDAELVSRAGLGLSWLRLEPGDLARRVQAIRAALAPRAVTVLDGAAAVADPWPELSDGVATLMRRVKAQFDPAGIFRPGAFAGGI